MFNLQLASLIRENSKGNIILSSLILLAANWNDNISLAYPKTQN